jgi:dienelactone hydrolase
VHSTRSIGSFLILVALLAPGSGRAGPHSSAGPVPAGPGEEIVFHSGQVDLSGTLLRPKGPGPFPALVLLHGSGPDTRENLRPVATRLVEHGYAALIFDKRGCGRSTGSWISSSLQDLAGDGIAAIRFLASRPGIDSRHVGVWGCSQSGWYAPLVANAEPSVSFVIVITGGGAPPRETEWLYYTHALDEANVTAADRPRALDIVRRYFRYLEDGNGRAELLAALDSARAAPWFSAVDVRRILPSAELRPKWSWVSTYDPTAAIESLRVPTLVLFGGRDPFVPVSLAMERWASSLDRSAAPHVVRLFPEAGHGLTIGAHDPEPGKERAYADDYFEAMKAFLDQATGRE